MTARKIQQSRFKPAGHFSSGYEMVVEHGVTLDDIKHPNFYAHVAAFLRQGDEIKVLSDDNSMYAVVLVLKAERTSATVKVLQYNDLTNASDVVMIENKDLTMNDFEIKWRGPAAKWSVVRKNDNAVIREGLASKEDAEKSCGEYLKVMAA